MAQQLTLKEQIAFRSIFNEKRVYQRWYGRFFSFGMDYSRVKRVVGRIKNWFEWCKEWSKEGKHLNELAEKALKNNDYDINLKRIATLGFSLGGYLSPWVAAHEKRICCAVGNSGFAKIGGLAGAKKLNPIWQRGVTYLTGCENFEDAVIKFDLDITKAPPLDRPLLFFHAGKDEVMPSPKKQAGTIIKWAKGEKELIFYPDGEHCTVNYLDEVFPYILDWLKKHLFEFKSHTSGNNTL